ncbi:MAG: YceH family protein [Opitutales bacterium]|nr:YceH family protein [Opitutales bacterium]
MFDPSICFPLDRTEARVLGALMEKSVTTPEYYPMTVNSLLAACNQKTSREPVTDFDETEVLAALDRLREKGVARRVDVAGSRVPKFRQVFGEVLELDQAAFALLTLLFLRGPQTPGQLRARSERLHPFRDLDAIQATLDALMQRDEEPIALVRALPLRPGSKEVRYAQILADEDDPAGAGGTGAAADEPPPYAERVNQLAAQAARIEELETRLTATEEELVRLRSAFESFKSAFE